MKVLALHGFLGRGKDWGVLQKELSGPSTISLEWSTPDIFSSIDPMESRDSLREWARQFNDNIVNQGGQSSLLFGYSLGGRLALHLVLDRPNLWKGLVLFSTNTGCFMSSMDKLVRQGKDIQWAKKFQEGVWEQVVGEWDDQAIFSGEPSPSREEKNYSKRSLAGALSQWSVGSQDISLEELKTISIPILWLNGKNDGKYMDMQSILIENKIPGVFSVVPERGHRLISSLSKDTQEIILNYLAQF